MTASNDIQVPVMTGNHEEDRATLQAWATIGPWASTDRAKPILEMLGRVRLPEDCETLRTLALENDSEKRDQAALAALRIAERCWEFEHPAMEIPDLRASWIWLATRRGSIVAPLLLIHCLIELAATERVPGPDEGESRFVDRLSMVAEVFTDHLADHVTSASILEFAERMAAELRWHPTPEGPSRQVIERWTLDRN